MNTPVKEVELREARKQFRTFRRQWIPALKTITASASDIVGDWVFYRSTTTNRSLNKYEGPLLLFAIVASLMGLATIISILMKKTNSNSGFSTSSSTPRQHSFLSRSVTFLLGSEMILEDIPQFILTGLVQNDDERSIGLSGPAVFNITTSAFNFTFNLLDMFVPLDEEEYDDEEITVPGETKNDGIIETT